MVGGAAPRITIHCDMRHASPPSLSFPTRVFYSGTCSFELRNGYRSAMRIANRKPGMILRLALMCLICIGLGAVHFATLSSTGSLPPIGGAGHKGSRFVFADLDGDRIPDFALVETQRQTFANSDYAIRVRLSAGAESAIGVRGPMGGLRVAARDVNGDKNLDLIITADLDAGFIKVLLNDGHGNFSVVAPSEFLEKENQTNVAFRVPASIRSDAGVLAPARGPSGESDIQASAYNRGLSSEASSQPAVLLVLQPAVLSRLGRSPPLSVCLS